MVQRYDIWMFYDEWQVDETDDGDWVKYDDHAAELATLRAENERLREALSHIESRYEAGTIAHWKAKEALK